MVDKWFNIGVYLLRKLTKKNSISQLKLGMRNHKNFIVKVVYNKLRQYCLSLFKVQKHFDFVRTAV